MSTPLSPPAVGTIQDLVLKKVNKAKIMRWLILTNSVQRVIRLTYNVELMLHVSGMDFCSNI